MNRDHIHPSLAPGVSPERQVALVRVGEECAELAKEAGKALRFGPDNRYPVDGPTNNQKMRAELGDVIEAMADAGVLVRSPTFALFRRSLDL